MTRMAAAGVALAALTALAVAGLAERAAVAASITVLDHPHWFWILSALTRGIGRMFSIST